MSGGATFLWRGRPVPAVAGDTFAAALDRAGVRVLGREPSGLPRRYFCGIGACQGCVIRVDGTLVEACLTPVRPGAVAEPVAGEGGGHD
ncbi:2Fe-2S iron-sulfur cluster-binding protein [Azospirillum halopraeferens]|uniref:2Fe-2S iron-sulfur cluster-binding protein n=1 Tax=Azospirillum halopraeferens TaxID=34010 RepID=UPI0004027306|nr:2Fe-2S iron-sulfur cluster-binding protein [Azospirillum halopraeferens]